MRLLLSLLALFFYAAISAQVSFTVPTQVCTGQNYTLVAQNTAGANSYTWLVMPGGTSLTAASSSTALVTFTTAGNYTITLNTTIGSYSLSVAAAVTPTLSFAQSAYTTCIASNFPKYSHPIKVVFSGATNYVCFPIINSPPFSPPPANSTFDLRPPQSMCYTVTGQLGACSATVPVCFTVIPQFTIDVSGTFIYCEPVAASMSVSGISSLFGPAYTYSWTESLAEVGSLSNQYTPSVEARPQFATTYTVEVKDSEKCISMPKEVQVAKSICTALDEINNGVKYNVYPNPCLDYFSVKADNLVVIRLRLYNSDAALVFEKTDLTEEKIFTHSLTEGLYTLEILSETGLHREKLFVIK